MRCAHIRIVDEFALDGLGTGERDERLAGDAVRLAELARLQRAEQGDEVEAARRLELRLLDLQRLRGGEIVGRRRLRASDGGRTRHPRRPLRRDRVPAAGAQRKRDANELHNKHRRVARRSLSSSDQQATAAAAAKHAAN